MSRTLDDATTMKLLESYHAGMRRLLQKRLQRAAEEARLTVSPDQIKEITEELSRPHENVNKKFLNLPV